MEATVTIVDLAPAPTKAREPLLDLGFERGHWPAAGTSATVERENLSLWSEFLAHVDFFHHFNFYNIRGEMTPQTVFKTATRELGPTSARRSIHSPAISSLESMLPTTARS